MQGERDSFGGVSEVDGYELSSSIELAWMPDGNHSLVPRVRSGFTAAQNLDEATARIAAFVQRL